LRGAQAFALVPSTLDYIYLYIGKTVPASETVQIGDRIIQRHSKAMVHMWRKFPVPVDVDASIPASLASLLSTCVPPLSLSAPVTSAEKKPKKTPGRKARTEATEAPSSTKQPKPKERIKPRKKSALKSG